MLLSEKDAWSAVDERGDGLIVWVEEMDAVFSLRVREMDDVLGVRPDE